MTDYDHIADINGSGYGDGDGYGDGSGYGYGYGGGDGDGDGYGHGSGDVYVDGSGYGSGHGHGCAEGNGYGDGGGYGGAYGSGDGNGNGYGHGYGNEIEIPESSAMRTYHYVQQNNEGNLVLRNGDIAQIGQTLHEPDITMCERGLHSSLTPEDAKQYAPHGSVLTECLSWGKVIFDKDKLVATHRRAVRVITTSSSGDLKCTQ